MRPPAMILAGGLARRLGGGDKTLRQLGGVPILDHVVRLVAPQCGRLVLNANGDPGRFALWGLPIVPDPITGHPGPLAGILAAMEWSANEAPGETHVLTVPADCPFLPVDLVARLADASASAGSGAIAASAGRSHPVVGLWPVAGSQALRRALLSEGMRRLSDWTSRLEMAVVEWPAAPFDPFFNVNTEKDLAEAQAMAEIASP